jgi:hypothetical protein
VEDDRSREESLTGEDLAEYAIEGSLAAAPSFADLLLHGSGIAMGAAAGALMAVINRYTLRQTQRLIEALQRRVAALEAAGKLNYERLEQLEESAAPAIAANAVSTPEKTELFADLLAGSISIDVPDNVDVESFVSTLQTLSPSEIDIARRVYDLWENDHIEGTVVPPRGYNVHTGEDGDYYLKRLEGAGLLVPVVRTGPVGAGVRVEGYEPTHTLRRLTALLRHGRAGL